MSVNCSYVPLFVGVYIPITDIGVANGIAPLGPDLKIPAQYMPISAMEYKGNWNPVTNIPALADGTGNMGDWYTISVNGTRDLGGGNKDYKAGAYLMYTGTVWVTSPNSGAVTQTITSGVTTSSPSEDVVYTALQGKSNTGHTHAFSALTGIPTDLAGYGITDAASSTHTHAFAALTGIPTTLAGYGITDAAGISHSHAFGSLSGIPTTLLGYGITDAAALIHTHAFSALTGIPTTLAGYGITDAASISHTHTFASLTSKPTTLAGFGITDGVINTRTISVTSPLTGGGDLSANRTIALAGLSGLGTANQMLGMNAGATGYEYKTLATGTAGTDFGIAHTANTITVNLPTASAANRGLLSTTDWTTFNAKESALTFSGPLSRSVNTISMPVATSGVNGYLASSDWTIFNNKVSTTRSISTTSPLTGGGDLSANRTIAINDAAADGTTKGAATFKAADFDSASGLISIDYINGQKASAGQNGFLSATDYATFASASSAWSKQQDYGTITNNGSAANIVITPGNNKVMTVVYDYRGRNASTGAVISGRRQALVSTNGAGVPIIVGENFVYPQIMNLAGGASVTLAIQGNSIEVTEASTPGAGPITWYINAEYIIN